MIGDPDSKVWSSNPECKCQLGTCYTQKLQCKTCPCRVQKFVTNTAYINLNLWRYTVFDLYKSKKFSSTSVLSNKILHISFIAI